MSPEPKKRPRRIPYTPEEVANIIAVKKKREQERLERLKLTRTYKFQNVFNVLCFFLYWEIVFCFFGPASYQRHYSIKVDLHYGERYDAKGNAAISEIDFYCVDGKSYKMVIDDFVPVPPKYGSFVIAKDFLLHKNLRGNYINASPDFRLFSANPILLIILLTLITSSVAYAYNLNENAHSLTALTVLNALALTGVLTL